MSRSLALALVTFLLLPGVSPAYPGSPGEPGAGETAGVRWFRGSLEEALAKARAEHKLVLVDCWARWCRYCRVMDRKTWSLPEVARVVAQETVPLRAEVDAHRGVGKSWQERYGVLALPAVLLLEPREGKKVEHLLGFQDAAHLLSAIDRARAAAFPGEETRAAGNDPGALARAGGRLARAGRREEAIRALRRAIDLDRDCRRDARDDAALALAPLLGEKERFRVLAGAWEACPRASARGELWQRLAEAGAKLPDPAPWGELLARRVREAPDDPGAACDRAEWLLGPGKDPAGALALARRAADLAPADPRPWSLAARALHALGRNREALAAVGKAVDLAPWDPDLRDLRLRISLAVRRETGRDGNRAEPGGLDRDNPDH